MIMQLLDLELKMSLLDYFGIFY